MNDVTNGQIDPAHYGPIGDAARNIASYCDGPARVHVYTVAFAALSTAEAEAAELRAEGDWWKGAAKALAEREAEYRKAHDLHGDSSMNAGWAWDLMRKQGDRIRAALTGGTPHE